MKKDIRFLVLPRSVIGFKLIHKTQIILIANICFRHKKNLSSDLSNVDMICLKGFSIGFLFKGGDDIECNK